MEKEVFRYNQDNSDTMHSTFYEQLVDLRANHHGGFINDRGYKNKKSPNDKIGITYAYWATINALKMD